jgi:hypothetical protein
VFPDVEEAPDHVCVADLAAVVPVRLPLQPVPGIQHQLGTALTVSLYPVW